MSKTIQYRIDPQRLPAFTAEQATELDALKTAPESAIDCSDIPELDESFWKNAVPNPFYRPTKTSTTVRIDSDVLLWLRAQGRGYQTRINAILRKEMLAEFKR